MRIAILIISVKNDDYQQLFDTVNSTWVNQYKSLCDIFHIIGGNEVEYIDNNMMYFRCKEGLSEIGYKTIKAFEKIQNTYDYIIRTNLSSYINVSVLIDWLKIQPRVNFWSGYGERHFSSGAFYILSNDLINKIIENKNKWDHSKLDDVAISELLYNEVQINCQFIKRIQFIYDSIYLTEEFQISKSLNFEEIDLKNIHFRFASKDPNRKIDCYNMNKLHNKIIGIQ